MYYRPASPSARPPVLRLVNTPPGRAQAGNTTPVETPRPASGPRVVNLAALRMTGAGARRSAAPVRPAPAKTGSVADASMPAEGAGWSDVVRENLAARSFAVGEARGGLGATDPRWLLAVKTSSLLEGGKAALLTPAKRRSVMTLAKQLGLRPFEASLVVAVVQDGARAGEGALSPGVKQRLSLVAAGSSAVPAEPKRARWAGLMGFAAALGGVLTALLIRWLEG